MPHFIAGFFNGDGYWENDSRTIFICTDSFTLSEVQAMIKILYIKYGQISQEV
jgi:hypothetical protein